MRILFCTYEGGGHVGPMLRVARAAQDRGHTVRVVSDACNAPDALAEGLPFEPWRTAPNRADKNPAGDPLRDWEADNPAAMIAQLTDRLLVGPAVDYALDVRAIAGEVGAELVVSQELLFGVMVGAESLGLPFVVLTANIWCFPTLPDQPPFGAGLPQSASAEDQTRDAMIGLVTKQLYDARLPDWNAIRAGFGLPELVALLDQPHRARRILLSTARAFDFAPDPLPEPFRYIGPQVGVPAWSAGWNSPWPDADPRPLVLISFSTLFQDQGPAIRACMAAVDHLGVRAVVTLGPTLDPADFPSTETVHVLASASHDALMPHIAAIVTHGGHGTVIRPLRHGVPLLCLPMGRDQPDNAARVEARGAGLTLPPNAGAAEIAAALHRLLHEADFRTNAARLGQAIDCADGETDAVRELESAAN